MEWGEGVSEANSEQEWDELYEEALLVAELLGLPDGDEPDELASAKDTPPEKSGGVQYLRA